MAHAKMRAMSGVLFIVLFLLPGLVGGKEEERYAGAGTQSQSAGAQKISGASAKDAQGSLYTLSPSDFFDLKRVNSPIDLDNIDHALLSAALFQETNLRRREHDKKPLEHLPRLDEAARMHADDMAEHEYVGHINPREPELRTPEDRVREVGLTDIRYVAENVASHYGIQYTPGKPVYPRRQDGDVEFTYKPGGKPIPNHTYRSLATSLLDDWMASPGHRKNILDERPQFLSAGCSISRDEKRIDTFYCVQVFFAR